MTENFASRIVRVLVLAMFVLVSPLWVQGEAYASGNFAWAKSMGGVSWDSGFSLAVDSAGNVYTAGSFKGTADFDPGPGVYNLTSAEGWDLFVSKLDHHGNFVWAGSIHGGDSDEHIDLALDTGGNLYTTGSFGGTMDFDPGVNAYYLTSAGEHDIFVSKWDSNGSFLWAKSMGGMDCDQGRGLAVDNGGNTYTTGYFRGTADFDSGMVKTSLTSVGSSDIFISKLDSNGNLVWTRNLGGPASDQGESLVIDAAGNVYTTGTFEGIADFDPGAGIYNLTSAGGSDVFVSKLDANGNYLWAKSMGGMDSDGGSSLAVNTGGSVYTTGSFEATADFDPAADAYNLTSAGVEDIFISKLDSHGDFVWAKSMGGVGNELSSSLVVDTVSNVYTTGYFGSFEAVVDFDPGADVYNLTNAGGTDIFVSKLDSNGSFLWAKSMGGINGDGSKDIAIDASGNVYTTGYFGNIADFDPGAGTANLTSAVAQDIFIAKLQEGDSFEPDNSPAEAKEISPGVPQTHNLAPATDVDWVKFTLPAASGVILETSGAADADTQMSLYASTDLVNPFGYNNDKDAAGGNHYSALAYTCFVNPLPAGTYYARIDEMGNDQEIADYQISLTVAGCPSAATFSDVPSDYWAWSFIERLYSAGIAGGCATGPLRYCPEGTVTRAQMAVFLLRGIHTSSYAPPAVGSTTGFGDVPMDYWAAAFIKQLAAEGITTGCGSGNYCPENSVTRAQMAVFLLRSKYGASYTPPGVGAGTGLGDVPPDYWAAAFIKQLVTEGITAGCGSGNYCPETPVTRAQMAVFLVRTFSLP